MGSDVIIFSDHIWSQKDEAKCRPLTNGSAMGATPKYMSKMF